MNIVLIGMPGCGKSTIGVLLAKTLLLDFADTDLLIQNKHNLSLCELIRTYGLEGFKKIENEILSSFAGDNCVVATGGSAIYGKNAMKNLKKNGRVIYLKLSPADISHRIQNITARGIAMPNGCTIEQLYVERAPLYEQYADITIDCTGLSAEECVGKIVDSIR